MRLAKVADVRPGTDAGTFGMHRGNSIQISRNLLIDSNPSRTYNVSDTAITVGLLSVLWMDSILTCMQIGYVAGAA